MVTGLSFWVKVMSQHLYQVTDVLTLNSHKPWIFFIMSIDLCVFLKLLDSVFLVDLLLLKYNSNKIIWGQDELGWFIIKDYMMNFQTYIDYK